MSTNINYDNLFSTAVEDRVNDVYLLAMAQMDDKTLQAYCITNKFNSKLCDNEAFWLHRIREAGLWALMPYRSMYNNNLRKFYFNVRKDAYYITGGGDISTNIFSNIQGAFNYIYRSILMDLNDLVFTPGYEPTELDANGNVTINYDKLQQYPEFAESNITIMFKNTRVTDPYVIFSLDKKSPVYLTDISVYPELNPDMVVLYKNIPKRIDPNKPIIITSFDDNGIRYLKQVVGNNGDNNNEQANNLSSFYMLTLDNNRVYSDYLNYYWMSLPVGIVTSINKGQRAHKLLLIDLSEVHGPTRAELQGVSGYVLVVLTMNDWYKARVQAGYPHSSNTEYLRRFILVTGAVYQLSDLQRVLATITD